MMQDEGIAITEEFKPHLWHYWTGGDGKEMLRRQVNFPSETPEWEYKPIDPADPIRTRAVTLTEFTESARRIAYEVVQADLVETE